MIKYSIIIPVCGNNVTTRKCIESIKENTKNFEIIIVDNGSLPVYTGEGQIIRNIKNEGFPVAVNQGLRQAKGEILVILNNDILTTPGWLDNLAGHLKKYDLVGPVSNNVSGIQQIDYDSYNDKGGLYEFAEKNRKEHLGDIFDWYRLVFFCVAFKREVLNKIGFVDEIFTPGNFEDDDFCFRAIDAGLKLGVATDVFIHHIGGITHKSLNVDIKKLLTDNQAKLINKWPLKKQEELKNKAVANSSVKLLDPDSPLSLVMIVKDEAKGLEKAILSCRGLVSSIVIAIDNATTDETEVIAKKYATTIKHFDFKDNFAAARNFAHEGIKTKFVLFLDGHEFVKSAPDLVEMLKKDCDSFLCSVEMDDGSKFRNPRIYASTLNFFGAIHEQQNCKKMLPYLKFVVKHDRLNKQSVASAVARENQRNKQMPEIMGKMIKANKKNTRASFHLYLYYQARLKFKEANKYLKLFLKYSLDHGDRWFVLFNHSISFLMRRKFYKAYITACSADNEERGRWEIEKLKGMIFFDQGNYVRAADFFVRSFHENTEYCAFTPWRRDYAATWNLVGECFFRLGDYFKASEAFAQASVCCENKDFKKILDRRANLMVELEKDKRSLKK